MTLHTPLWLQAAPGDTAITYTATDDRGVISALAPNAGTVLAGDLAVSQRSAGANMSVDVAAGRAVVKGTSLANQGTYIVFNDATLNVPLTAASTSNPRIDLIVYRVYDKQSDGGSQYGSDIYAVPGTPASTPVAPGVPANSLVLAQVTVPANDTAITSDQISDKRTLAGVGDVPKWDMSNTPASPQQIPSGTSTYYQPPAHFQSIGVTVDATLAKVQILTPGRYVVHFGVALAASANAGPRQSTIQLLDPDGTTVRRTIAQETISSAASPVTASGSLYAVAGTYVVARIYQATGQTLGIADNFFTADFTGVWIGS